MAHLPIDDARAAFATALGTGDPIVVCAPTGSGKSTRLPGWLRDSGDKRVLVVEPRRIAARALAGWVAKQRGGKLGEEVGYQVRFDGRRGPNTKILFVTPGVALSMLSDGEPGRIAPGLAQFDAVLVDEFHERAWEVDLLVALTRLARAESKTRSGDPVPSCALILCSATLAEAELSASLGATVVRSQGRAFDVDITYQGEGPPTHRELDSRVADAVRDALGRSDGDVLVFLPGKREIEAAARALHGCAATVVPVHGGLSPARMAAALAPSSQRRIFVSTNVAETSLTLPGVRTVVDSGLARMRVHQAGHSVLALGPISQASADQRAGRAGRVAAGTCIRLWSRHYAAQASTPPEVLRVELDDVLLRAASAGLPGARFVAAPWVTQPPAFAVAAAQQRLADAGDLDATGEITPNGRTRARLPVSAWAGRILANPPAALAGLVADVVAIAELGRDLVVREFGDAQSAADEARAELFAGATDDLEVQLRALWAGDPARHGVHAGLLKEARNMASQLRERIGAPRSSRADGSKCRLAAADRDALVAHLLARSPESAFVPRSGRRGTDGAATRHGTTAWGNGQCEVLLRRVSVPGVAAASQPKAPLAAIVLDLEWLGVGRSAQGRGRLGLACRPADLLAAGIGESRVGTALLARERGRREVVADVEVTFAGTTLHSERKALRGAALLSGIAQLMLDGRMRSFDSAALLDALHLESLLRQLAPTSTSEGPTATTHDELAGRLETLGVQTLADLELIGVEDLTADLDAAALRWGIDAREPAALRRDFPRLWAYQGTSFQCSVDMARRMVVLEPLRSKGKGREPPTSVLPRFRGFGVEYRKASRHVRLR